MVVWCVRPVEPERHILPTGPEHQPLQRDQMVLLERLRLLTQGHHHDDPTSRLPTDSSQVKKVKRSKTWGEARLTRRHKSKNVQQLVARLCWCRRRRRCRWLFRDKRTLFLKGLIMANDSTWDGWSYRLMRVWLVMPSWKLTFCVSDVVSYFPGVALQHLICQIIKTKYFLQTVSAIILSEAYLFISEHIVNMLISWFYEGFKTQKLTMVQRVKPWAYCSVKTKETNCTETSLVQPSW